MGIIRDGEETSLSAIKPCEMKVLVNGALDMNISLPLTSVKG